MRILLHACCFSEDKAIKVRKKLERDKELALRIAKITLRDGEATSICFAGEHWFSVNVLLVDSVDARIVEFFNDRDNTSFCLTLDASELSLVTRLLPDKKNHQYFYNL